MHLLRCFCMWTPLSLSLYLLLIVVRSNEWGCIDNNQHVWDFTRVWLFARKEDFHLYAVDLTCISISIWTSHYWTCGPASCFSTLVKRISTGTVDFKKVCVIAFWNWFSECFLILQSRSYVLCNNLLRVLRPISWINQERSIDCRHRGLIHLADWVTYTDPVMLQAI